MHQPKNQKTVLHLPQSLSGLNTVAIDSLKELVTKAAEDKPGSDYVSVYDAINPPK